ncbi:hypothetical protein MMC31_001195 [Peltigera leucophlebia]|nr:hypothetical protein [Peltigera leucophlebia]
MGAKPGRLERSEGNVWEEKWKLERDLALKVKACRELESQIDNLNRACGDVEFQLQQVSLEKNNMVKQHGDRIKALTLEHSRNMSNSNEENSRALASLTQKHNNYLMEREAYFAQQSKNLETRHSEQVSKLTGQLLDNQDDNQGWPDDKLKFRFKQLQRLIEMLTSPRNMEFVIPLNQQLRPGLDPTNFLGRVGRKKFHFMLKSMIWAILQEQFFSAPFGYGALGPDKGQIELLNVYRTWRKSFDEGADTASQIDGDLAIFRQDNLANKWRSANFQCINVVLSGGGKRNLARHSPLAKLSADNVQKTVDRIIGVLSEVSRLSNSLVPSYVEAEIHKMADLAREIALQFGVHTAQLRLSVPHHGAQIRIGEEFYDCEDGDSERGTVYQVDLVIFPGLERIGDGRSDMSSKQIITPCEIYPGAKHS